MLVSNGDFRSRDFTITGRFTVQMDTVHGHCSIRSEDASAFCLKLWKVPFYMYRFESVLKSSKYERQISEIKADLIEILNFWKLISMRTVLSILSDLSSTGHTFFRVDMSFFSITFSFTFHCFLFTFLSHSSAVNSKALSHLE